MGRFFAVVVGVALGYAAARIMLKVLKEKEDFHDPHQDPRSWGVGA